MDSLWCIFLGLKTCFWVRFVESYQDISYYSIFSIQTRNILLLNTSKMCFATTQHPPLEFGKWTVK